MKHWHIAYPGTTRLVAPIKRWTYARKEDAERAKAIIERTPGNGAAIVEREGSVSACKCRN